MGIREHLSKEVDEKEMKLSDLEMDVDKKKEEPFFDAGRDISEARIRELNDALDIFRKEVARQYAFADVAAGLKVLFPNRVEDFDFGDVDWEMLEPALQARGHRIEDSIERNNSSRDYVINLKILFPNEVNDYDLGAYFEIMKADLKSLLKIKAFGFAVIETMFKLKFLFDYEDESIELDDEAWKIIENYLIYCYKKNLGFTRSLARVKLLFPNRFKEMEFDKKFKQELAQQLDRVVHGSSSAQEAMWLKILAADDVRITKQGFEFGDGGPKKSFKQEKKTRPERKTF